MHYYSFNIGDYARDTGHLTVIEHGIYRLLLDWCYLNEKPITTEQAMRVGRGFPKETQSVLSEFFSQNTDGWTQHRIGIEVEKFHAKARVNRENGAKGGRPKPKNNPVGSQTNAKHNPNQEPITKNQEPNTSEAIASGGKPPLTPAEIIFGYGVPILTNAGTAEKQARSFLGGLRKAHGDDALVNALRDCIRAKPLQPLEWLAKAMLPDATGAPAETRYQRSKREQMERDFPNLTNKTEFQNVASIELD